MEVIHEGNVAEVVAEVCMAHDESVARNYVGEGIGVALSCTAFSATALKPIRCVRCNKKGISLSDKGSSLSSQNHLKKETSLYMVWSC